jgi:hypothetical protein
MQRARDESWTARSARGLQQGEDGLGVLAGQPHGTVARFKFAKNHLNNCLE